MRHRAGGFRIGEYPDSQRTRAAAVGLLAPAVAGGGGVELSPRPARFKVEQSRHVARSPTPEGVRAAIAWPAALPFLAPAIWLCSNRRGRRPHEVVPREKVENCWAWAGVLQRARPFPVPRASF
jgi:hypothetical protein